MGIVAQRITLPEMMKMAKIEKLVCNLNNKENYVLHIQNL